MAETLVLDVATRDVIAVLEAAHIPVILLKGPSIARWLYPEGGRVSVDVDLLVPRARLSDVGALLSGAGFRTVDTSLAVWDRPGYANWIDERSVCIDLHVTLPRLEQLPTEAVWDALFASSELIDLKGNHVRVLARPALAFHIVLHALAHGPSSGQPLEDLRRLLNVLRIEEWDLVFAMARSLSASALLEEGLRLEPKSAPVLERLGSHSQDRGSAVRDKGSSDQVTWAALAFDWWLRLPFRQKVAMMVGKLFPRSEYLKERSALARRGTAGIAVAYLVRPFVVLTHALRGGVLLARASIGTRKAHKP